MTVTELKPDNESFNDKDKIVGVFELTVPFEENIKARNRQKSNKYGHVATGIKTHKATITAFEIRARGYLTSEKEARLKNICSFCEKGTKSREFLIFFFIYSHHKQLISLPESSRHGPHLVS